MASANLVELTTHNWGQEEVHTDKPVVVAFLAPWFGPCRAPPPANHHPSPSTRSGGLVDNGYAPPASLPTTHRHGRPPAPRPPRPRGGTDRRERPPQRGPQAARRRADALRQRRGLRRAPQRRGHPPHP